MTALIMAHIVQGVLVFYSIEWGLRHNQLITELRVFLWSLALSIDTIYSKAHRTVWAKTHVQRSFKETLALVLQIPKYQEWSAKLIM
jgi:hypothetical protein